MVRRPQEKFSCTSREHQCSWIAANELGALFIQCSLFLCLFLSHYLWLGHLNEGQIAWSCFRSGWGNVSGPYHSGAWLHTHGHDWRGDGAMILSSFRCCICYPASGLQLIEVSHDSFTIACASVCTPLKRCYAKRTTGKTMRRKVARLPANSLSVWTRLNRWSGCSGS